jgi:hypothetical protein
MSIDKASKIAAAVGDIKTLLEQITVVNGYNFTPTLKEGWLQHVFQDRMRKPKDFPIIAYRPELSAPGEGQKTQNRQLNDKITFSIDCAISVKETETPVVDLLNLLKDVRRSLVVDQYKNKLSLSEITFQECQFDVPETGDKYAFFSQKIQFEVDEQYA